MRTLPHVVKSVMTKIQTISVTKSKQTSSINKAKICSIEVLKEPTEETIDDCAVPLFLHSLDNVYDMPSCVVPTFSSLLEQYKSLFRTSPGSTTVAEHFIPTTGTV